MDIADTLLFRFQARFPVIWLESYDDPRVYKVLKEVCKAEDYNLYRWSMVDGLVELGLTLDTVLPVGDTKMEAQQTLTEMLNRMDSYEKEIFVLDGAMDLLNYLDIKTLIKKIAIDLPKARKPMHLILISPEAKVPLELARYLDILTFPECGKDDYAEVLNKVTKSYQLEISESTREKLIEAADGLTTLEAERIYSLAASETYLEETAIDVIQRERDRINEKLAGLGARRN